MATVQVALGEIEDKVVNIYKALHGLKRKDDAICCIIRDAGRSMETVPVIFPGRKAGGGEKQ